MSRGLARRTVPFPRSSVKPNLLFVFADQMRGMDMGCAGNGEVKTPHLDRLAESGRRFTEAIATTPVCGPNRACLLTGMTPLHAGVPVNDIALSKNLPTFGTIAKANGYRTGYVGKWHLDGLPRDKFTPPGERRRGFDYWAAFNCFHDYFTPRYFRDSPEMILGEGYEPFLQTDLAIDFIKENSASPFALMLSWGPPHDPYPDVPAEFRGMYDAEKLTLRPNAEPDAPNPLAAHLDCRDTYACYYGAITALDREMGRLMQTVEELGLSDNTLIIFTSDHGDMLWSHGYLKKQLPFQESIQVPFIASLPGTIPAGSTSDCLLGTADLLPTLCRLLDWRTDASFDGRDLSQAFVTDASRPEPLLLANFVTTDESLPQNVPDWRGVYTGDTTYVEKPGRVPWLLFDNKRDPFQLSNLVDRPEAAAVQGEQQAELTKLLVASGDSFLPGQELVRDMGLWDEYKLLEKPRYSEPIQSEIQQGYVRRRALAVPKRKSTLR
jgi:arylsulfatase A-like enzyme